MGTLNPTIPYQSILIWEKRSVVMVSEPKPKTPVFKNRRTPKPQFSADFGFNQKKTNFNVQQYLEILGLF